MCTQMLENVRDNLAFFYRYIDGGGRVAPGCPLQSSNDDPGKSAECPLIVRR